MTSIASALGMQSAPQHTPFHWWQGASGEWWITSVYPLGVTFHTMPAVYVMVRRNPDGRCEPIYIGETENCTERMKQHAQGGKIIQAAMLGANELHVHLLAISNYERLAVETDLRRGHWTPLNQQPGGLFALAGLPIPKYR